MQDVEQSLPDTPPQLKLSMNPHEDDPSDEDYNSDICSEAGQSFAGDSFVGGASIAMPIYEDEELDEGDAVSLAASSLADSRHRRRAFNRSTSFDSNMNDSTAAGAGSSHHQRLLRRSASSRQFLEQQQRIFERSSQVSMTDSEDEEWYSEIEDEDDDEDEEDMTDGGTVASNVSGVDIEAKKLRNYRQGTVLCWLVAAICSLVLMWVGIVNAPSNKRVVSPSYSVTKDNETEHTTLLEHTIVQQFSTELSHGRSHLQHLAWTITNQAAVGMLEEKNSAAKNATSTWPFVTLPAWEQLTNNRENAEWTAYAPIVPQEVYTLWNEYARKQLDQPATNGSVVKTEHALNIPLYQITSGKHKDSLFLTDVYHEQPWLEAILNSIMLSGDKAASKALLLPPNADNSWLIEGSSDTFAVESRPNGTLRGRRQLNEDRTNNSPLVLLVQPIMATLSSPLVVVGFAFKLMHLNSLLNTASWATTANELRHAHFMLQPSCGDGDSQLQIKPVAQFMLVHEGNNITTWRSTNDVDLTADTVPIRMRSDLLLAYTNKNSTCSLDILISAPLPNQSPTGSITNEVGMNPQLYALLFVAALVLVFSGAYCTFHLYDNAVQKRQSNILDAAHRTTAIVSEMFPQQVQRRIFAAAQNEGSSNPHINAKNFQGQAPIKEYGFGHSGSEEFTISPRRRRAGFKDQMNSALATAEDELLNDTSLHKNLIQHPDEKPIADLFPETSIMFADITGFTAWSSMREPSQVFMLLESIFKKYDEIAKRRRVFKVETVGDCYVAACGVPDARKEHAVVMARYARDCLHAFRKLTTQLEISLGPDTSDLGMRFGLHSGPVTAGVLRGDRARFQLFGDTMNTTARIESTGAKNRIHLSQEIADLLIEAGRSHWVVRREDKVVAKGKGELQTFWLEIKSNKARAKDDKLRQSTVSTMLESELFNRSSGNLSHTDNRSFHSYDASTVVSRTQSVQIMTANQTVSAKHARLVDWITDLLIRNLQSVSARRESLQIPSDNEEDLQRLEATNGIMAYGVETRSVLDELQDVIVLPQFDIKAAQNERDPNLVDLGQIVCAQIHDYVQTISVMYRDNPFHNFEHVSHVTMSVTKLLSRIIAPTEDCQTDASLHDHTYGITSDPLTRFAVIFSALIHDVDHQGVTNAELIAEHANIASVYDNKSIAEQNSVDIAWELLMDDHFTDFRRAIYTTEKEFCRFRQLVVNAVIATDIMDKDLSKARKERWNIAFAEDALAVKETNLQATNRRATIVIEHLIQASDVVHTMQHWHIFRKWNERLFKERYKAYREGRCNSDPSLGWYDGEKGFFDFYVIPLAKKLKNCGVFGVSSDEYLNYATQNRREWESKGQSIVEEMMDNVRQDAGEYD